MGVAHSVYFLLTILIYTNVIRSQDEDAELLETTENITKILTSKIALNETEKYGNITPKLSMFEDPQNFENGTDYADYSLLPPQYVDKLYRIAKTKTFMAVREFNRTIKRRDNSKEAFFPLYAFNGKSLDLMKQSIYATRYRLRDTIPIRKRYSEEFGFTGAIMYGSLMQLRIKIDNIVTTMSKLNKTSTPIVYYLTLYERALTIHVDVESMVERLFRVQKVLTSIMRGSGEKLQFKDMFG